MNRQGFENMINRVAGTPPEVTPEEESLLKIDTAFDRILNSISDVGENLPKIVPQNNDETVAVNKMREIFETAINPYFADVLEAWRIFEGE